MTESKIRELYEVLVASKRRRLEEREIRAAQETLAVLPEKAGPYDLWERTPILNDFEIDLYCM